MHCWNMHRMRTAVRAACVLCMYCMCIILWYLCTAVLHSAYGEHEIGVWICLFHSFNVINNIVSIVDVGYKGNNYHIITRMMKTNYHCPRPPWDHYLCQVPGLVTAIVRPIFLVGNYFLRIPQFLYCKASSRGAYGHDPFGSVFEEHRLDSTTTDITTATIYIIDNVIVLSDLVESSGYSSKTLQKGSCSYGALDEALRYSAYHFQTASLYVWGVLPRL